MTITKNLYGYYVISTIYKGYLIEKRYHGYTKKECIKMFKKELKAL